MDQPPPDPASCGGAVHGGNCHRLQNSRKSACFTAQATLFMLAGAGNTDAQELRGGMSGHIKGFYTITDGDLMLEVNALKDAFCITFQVVNKDQTPLNLFCEALKQEGIPYSVSERFTRYMPKIKLPSCG